LRIVRLDLIRFGSFTETSLELREPCPGLHIVYGPNEAGKSTALRAVSDLLFGIPHLSPDAHRHSSRELLIGGELAFSDGESLCLLRRKGRKNTLLDPGQNPLEESLLTHRLGGVTREIFERMFGFDHMRLVAGGRELLQGRGSLQEALFGAAAGLSGLHEVIRSLDAEAGDLFKSSGKRPLLNQALSAHREALAAMREATLRPEEWERLRRAVADAQSQLEATRCEHARVRSELDRKRTLLGALPDLRSLQGLRLRRDELGAVPSLPTDAAQRRTRAESTLREAARRSEELRDEAQGIRSELRSLEVPDRLLELTSRVEQLEPRHGAYVEALRDREKLVARQQELRQSIDAQLHELPGRPSLEELEARTPSRVDEARFRRMIRNGMALEAELRRLEEAVRNARKLVQTREAELAARPSVADTRTLTAITHAARTAIGVETQIAEQRAEFEALRREALQRLQALPLVHANPGGSPLELADIARLPVPPLPSIDRFDQSFRDLDEAERDLARRMRELETRAGELERERTELGEFEDLPSRTDVLRARADRGELWHRMSGAWVAGREPPEAIGELAARFEYATQRADEIADRLFEAHERVVKREALDAAAIALEASQKRAHDEQAQCEQQRTRVAEEWTALWRACGIDPLPAPDMREFREQQQKLTQSVYRLEQLQASIESNQERVESQRSQLLRELAAVEWAPASPPEGLAALVEWADAQLRQLESERSRRRELDRDLEAGRAALREAEAERDRTLGAQLEWRTLFRECTGTLGMQPDDSPEDVETVIGQWMDLRTQAQKLRSDESRVHHIDERGAQFEAEVEAVIGLAELEFEAGAAATRAAALLLEFREGSRMHERYQVRKQRLEKVEADLRALERDTTGAEAELARLISAAGVEDARELEAAERRSAEAASLDQRMREIEEHLIRAGGSVQALEAAATGIDEPNLRREVEELHRTEKQLLELREQQSSQLRDREHELRAKTARSGAAEARAEAEAQLASIASLANEYARKHIASLLLKREMQRYAEQNQGPILERASTYFERMTLERFKGLRSDFAEDDTAVLVCERTDGSRIGVEQLSEGTRDQLHLSLRLAALEHHMERAESMPLVVDDVLMTFDDARARATLEIFGELSRTHQLLLFTHHAHLVELAVRSVPGTQMRLHGLGVEVPVPLGRLATSK